MNTDLSIFLETNGKPLPHVLITGSTGSGKTWSTSQLMESCGASYHIVNAAMLRTIEDLADAIKLACLNNPSATKCILVIDEIHNLSKGIHGIQQVMLTVLEKYEFSGKNRSWKINPRGWYGNFAVWGMTTNGEKLFAPLTKRFYHVSLSLPTTYEKIKLLRSRIPQATPEDIELFCKSCVSYRDMIYSIDMSERTSMTIESVLHTLGYNKYGINKEEREYIKALSDIGEHASLANIAARSVMDSATAKSIEANLVRKGIIAVTSKGRELVC